MDATRRQPTMPRALLLLSASLLAACSALVANSTAATPSAGPTLISADTAVAQAIAAAQAGGPYTRLDGAPTEIRAGLFQPRQPRWVVVLRGRVIETVPASADGSVPEREVILHQLMIVVEAQTAEAIEVKAFSPDHEMDASAYPLRALPVGPVATPPTRPAPATEAPLPTSTAAPTEAPASLVPVSDWLPYSGSQFNVTLRYPPNWQLAYVVARPNGSPDGPSNQSDGAP